MMYGRGKSDEAIVAGKSANKAERSAAEPVERRAEAKGNAGQQRTLWTQSQAARVTGAGRIRAIAPGWSVGPEGGAVCGKAARTDLWGGRGAILVPPATASHRRWHGCLGLARLCPRRPTLPSSAIAPAEPRGQ